MYVMADLPGAVLKYPGSKLRSFNFAKLVAGMAPCVIGTNYHYELRYFPLNEC